MIVKISQEVLDASPPLLETSEDLKSSSNPSSFISPFDQTGGIIINLTIVCDVFMFLCTCQKAVRVSYLL